MLPAELVQPGMQIRIGETDFTNINVGPDSRFDLFNLPFYLFGANEDTIDTWDDVRLDLSKTGNLRPDQRAEVEAKLPITQLNSVNHGAQKVEWPQLVIAPRGGNPAYVMSSYDDLKSGFDPISGVMRAIGQIKYSNGMSDKTSTQYYGAMIMVNDEGTYRSPGGGLGGGSIGAGDWTYGGVYFHEQGHAFGMPHSAQAYNSGSFPYDGGTLRGSNWGFDLNKEMFLGLTVPEDASSYERCTQSARRQYDAVGNCYKQDPMQGGNGDGSQDSYYSMFTDFNAAVVQKYFEYHGGYGENRGRATYFAEEDQWKHWNHDSESWVVLDPEDADAEIPYYMDTQVDTVVFTVSYPEIKALQDGDKKLEEMEVTQIYPPLENYLGNAARTIDMDNETELSSVHSSTGSGFCYWSDCDFTVKFIYTDGSSKRHLVKRLNWNPDYANSLRPTHSASFGVSAVTAPNNGKVLWKAELYLTPGSNDLNAYAGPVGDPLLVASVTTVNKSVLSNGTAEFWANTGDSRSNEYLLSDLVDEKGALTYFITEQPLHGTLEMLDNQTGQVKYIGNVNYEGSDSFSYHVFDEVGRFTASTATVSITIRTEQTSNCGALDAAVPGASENFSNCFTQTGADGNSEYYLIPSSNDMIVVASDHTYSTWTGAGGFAADRERMTKKLMNIFNDEFDFIVYVNQDDGNVVCDESNPCGDNVLVSNDVYGIGKDTSFDNTTAYGADKGKLQSIIHLRDDSSVMEGQLLHEIIHRWGGNFFRWSYYSYGYSDDQNDTPPTYWWNRGVGGGQLGGVDPTTMSEVVPIEYPLSTLFESYNLAMSVARAARDPYDHEFSPTGETNGRAHNVPYNDLELWLMGLLEPEQVDNISYFHAGTSSDPDSSTSTGVDLPPRRDILTDADPDEDDEGLMLFNSDARPSSSWNVNPRVDNVSLREILDNPLTGFGGAGTLPRATYGPNATQLNCNNNAQKYKCKTEDTFTDVFVTGDRVPNSSGSQKTFRALTVLITKPSLLEDNQAQVETFHQNLTDFAKDEALPAKPEWLEWKTTHEYHYPTDAVTKEEGGVKYIQRPDGEFNFYEATRGLADFQVDGLENALRSSE